MPTADFLTEVEFGKNANYAKKRSRATIVAFSGRVGFTGDLATCLHIRRRVTPVDLNPRASAHVLFMFLLFLKIS